jgi:hypothetical protein
MSDPYLKSSLAFFLPRDRVSDFRSRTQINSRTGLRIGIMDDPVFVARAKLTFPDAQFVAVPNYNTLPDFSRVDAALWTLTQAEAIAAAMFYGAACHRLCLATCQCPEFLGDRRFRR